MAKDKNEAEIIESTAELLDKKPEAERAGKFDLQADPFDTGFVFNEDLDTDGVILYMNKKDDYLGIKPDAPEPKHYQPEIWKAHCKAAIDAGWFKAPASWTVSAVGKWKLNQCFWLYNWIRLKYAEMLTIPFD